ncbi:MAG: ABC transporter permease [Lachnospiraceae bacterium]|nr:ABC transporter permease [Lachnospiraceae bacterium]
MRNPLLKRIPRDFRKNWSKYLGLFLILSLTIMIGSAFSSTLESTVRIMNTVETDNRLENGFFETSSPISDDLISQLEELELEIAAINYQRINDFDKSAKLLVFDERRKIDIPSIFDGKLPESPNEIAFDRIAAREHGLKIGSEVNLNGQSFTLCGTVAFPDYNSLFANNSDMVMNTTDFGVAVVNHEGFERFDKECTVYRYAYRFRNQDLSDSEKADKAEEIIKTLYSNMIVPGDFLTAEANQSISFLKNDIGKDGPMMEVFVYILIAVIAFVFAVLTNNTIDSEAPIIGTLRSLGYSKHEIIIHYLMPSVIVTLVASLVGNIIGYTLMLNPMYDLYYTTYSVPKIITVFSVPAFIKTTLIPVIIMPVINILMLRSKLSLSPLKFLRHDLKKGKTRRTVRLTRGSFPTRFRLRVILQNKGSYIMLFFGIIISTLLLIFGMGLAPMFDNYVDSIADSVTFENQYLLKTEYEITDSDAVFEKAEVTTLKTNYSLTDKDIDVSMLGIEPDSNFFREINLPPAENEGIISSAMANKLGLKAGDSVKLTHPYSGEEYTIKISGIYEYSGTIGIFLKRSNLNKLLANNEDAYNCYISDSKLDIPEAVIAKYITKKDMCGAAKQMLSSFDSILKLVNIFSVVIYMILLFILTKAVIEKNALSISYLKIFGYDNKEINKIFLRATSITVIISLAIAIPIDIMLIKLLMVYITAMIEGYISFWVPSRIYLLIAVICICAYYIINAIHVRSIRKIPMQEALKCRE